MNDTERALAAIRDGDFPVLCDLWWECRKLEAMGFAGYDADRSGEAAAGYFLTDAGLARIAAVLDEPAKEKTDDRT